MSVSRVRFHEIADADDDDDASSPQPQQHPLSPAEELAQQQAWREALQRAARGAGQTPSGDANANGNGNEVAAASPSDASPSAAADPPARLLRKHLSKRHSSAGSDMSEIDPDEEALQLVEDCGTAHVAKAAKLDRCPYLDAGLFSRLTYRWLTPLMSLGSKKTLGEDDLYEVMPHDNARILMDGMEKAYQQTQREAREKAAAAAAKAAAAKGDAASAAEAGAEASFSSSSSSSVRPRINLWRMLWLQFGRRYTLLQLVLLIYTGVKILQPLMLNQLVKFVSDPDEPVWHGYLYAIAMGLGAVGQAACHHQYFLHSVRVGIDVRIALNTLIFKKALTLRTRQMMKTTTGQVVNLVSSDSARSEDASIYFPFLWNCPVECAIVLALLYQQVGVAAFAGFGACLMLTPMQITFSRLFSKYRRYTATRTDARVKLINEILVGADVLKMMGWEESLEEKVSSVRADEFGSISRAARLKSINQAAFFSSQAIVSLVTFFTMYWRGVPFTPQTVFTTIALFNIIKLPLTNFIPFATEKLSEMKIGMDRIARFLELDQEVARDEARFGKQLAEVREWNASLKKQKEDDPKKFANGSIHLEQASFVWELTDEMQSDQQAAAAGAAGAAAGGDSAAAAAGGASLQPPSRSASPAPSPYSMPVGAAAAAASPSHSAALPSDGGGGGVDASQRDKRQGLRLLDVHIPPGKLVGVVGSIGSYKSSFLAALLGEMTQMHGGGLVSGSVAYASQVSWIFAGSIRENVLFGRPFEARRYARTLAACQLLDDIRMQSNGDQTMIGEKGVNLSGGQRARLSCARAVYGQSDIYLLDDPLAALDAVVARNLFHAVLSDEGGLLAGSTRVLVTHQTHLLTKAHILFMEHGQIKAQGSFDELIQQGFLTENQRHAQADNDSSVESEATKSRKRKEARERRRAKRKMAVLERAGSIVGSGSSMAPTSMASSSASTAASTNAIVLAESSSVGELDLSVFLRLFEAGGGIGAFIGLALIMAIGQAVSIVADKWLANWSGRSASAQRDDTQAWVYLGLVLATVTIAVVRSRLFFIFILRAASVLHGKMFRAVVFSPLRFFESNPAGRILNRFAKDQQIVDEMLPLTMFDFTGCTMMVIGCLVAVGISAPFVLLILIPILPLFIFVRRYYLATSRELKRLDAVTRSPVYALFSSSLSGLMVIRAFNSGEAFIDSFVEKVDANTRAFIMFQMSARWFGIRLDSIAASVVACLSLLVVGTRGSISPANAGFALSYCLQLTALFQWAVRQSAEVETMMTSVERIVEYGNLPREGQLINPEYRPPAGWPNQGAVTFKDFKMRYRPGLDLVLRGVDVTIEPGQKVGVCGRTGAGKSSLFQALLRLVERSDEGGPIIIDGMDSGRLGLKDLRAGLAIIPQYPVIFSGTLKYNLDPFETCSDEQLWNALEAVQLKNLVLGLRGGLDAEVVELGGNLSVGECQLLCVARALLKPSRVLLVDEATANVDSKTDALIQAVIRERFKDRTVITISHRLGTILDSDKIIVMAAGKVAEYGTPAELLARPPADLANFPQATFGLFSFMNLKRS